MPEEYYKDELKREEGNFFKTIVRGSGQITIPKEERNLWEGEIKANDTVYVKIILVERDGGLFKRKKTPPVNQLKINEVSRITKGKS